MHIITDTTSCLSQAVAKKYDIPVIPQVINFGSESYLEGVDIDIPTFMQKLKSSQQLPKTSAPPPELFIKEFERFVHSGEPILCIHPSVDVSGTVRSAQVAAEEFPGADIRIIDTRLLASPLGTLVELAAQWAEAGDDPAEIIHRLQELSKKCRIYFLVSTLEYLARGGRIGAASALLGGLLQIKPILSFHDGQVHPCEKERTHKKALAKMKEMVIAEISRQGPGYLTVMQADTDKEGQALAEDLAARLGLPHVPVFDMPPAIVTHGGPGILGAAFFSD